MLRRPAPAACERPQARQQLSQVKRLEQVVVGAAVEAGNPLQADGLRKALKLDEAFDSTSVENGAAVSFDGRWEAQKLTEEQYNARFAQDDERYARMLGILRAALARKTT